MEHAPLRPVPARPAGPVDQAAAEAAVRSALPGLEERQASALALVALAGRPRREATLRLQTAEEQLAAELARARKALRRTLAELPGSGWCERAERLVSDRLDGTLDGTGAARLDVHLRNCPRCVDHERRLVQATDALLASISARAPRRKPPLPVTTESKPRAGVVERPAAESRPAQSPSAEPEPEPVEPVPAPIVPPARPLPDVARAAGWHVLLLLAVLLAVASIALTVAGVLGAEL